MYFIGSLKVKPVDLNVTVLFRIKLLVVPIIKEILLLDDRLKLEYVDIKL